LCRYSSMTTLVRRLLLSMTEETVKEMMEERGPEECASLMVYLQKYCNEWGCKVKIISLSATTVSSRIGADS
jgi:hypothetical protein